MLRYAAGFLLIAIAAAMFGFGGIAADATWIARTLFYLFLISAVVTLVLGLIRR